MEAAEEKGCMTHPALESFELYLSVAPWHKSLHKREALESTYEPVYRGGEELPQAKTFFIAMAFC